MWQALMKWLEKNHEQEMELLELKNAHEKDMSICQSCEVLKTQLEVQNELIRNLTKREIQESEPVTAGNHKPIMPKFKPWAVRRAELEQADREKARILREEAEEITLENL